MLSHPRANITELTGNSDPSGLRLPSYPVELPDSSEIGVSCYSSDASIRPPCWRAAWVRSIVPVTCADHQHVVSTVQVRLSCRLRRDVVGILDRAFMHRFSGLSDLVACATALSRFGWTERTPNRENAVEAVCGRLTGNGGRWAPKERRRSRKHARVIRFGSLARIVVRRTRCILPIVLLQAPHSFRKRTRCA